MQPAETTSAPHIRDPRLLRLRTWRAPAGAHASWALRGVGTGQGRDGNPRRLLSTRSPFPYVATKQCLNARIECAQEGASPPTTSTFVIHSLSHSITHATHPLLAIETDGSPPTFSEMKSESML